MELRPIHEAPPWALTKRIMELRANHEAPPWALTKRVIELRPNHEAPPWELTKRFMELRPKPCQNHVSPTKHKVIMHTNLMPIFITNNPIMFHSKDHTKVINSSPYNQILHAYSPNSCFNKVIKSNMWCSTKNREETTLEHVPTQFSLKQNGSHSGERNPSLKQVLAWVRLQTRDLTSL